MGFPIGAKGGRTFVRNSKSIDFTSAASKGKAEVVAVDRETPTQHHRQRVGRCTVGSVSRAEKSPHMNTVTPESKKLSVTVPLNNGDSRIFRTLFPDITTSTSEDTSINPYATPHLPMKRSVSLTDLSTPSPSDDYTSNLSSRKKVKVSQGLQLKVS